MVGVRLEMKATLYTGPKTIIHNTKRQFNRQDMTLKILLLRRSQQTLTSLMMGSKILVLLLLI